MAQPQCPAAHHILHHPSHSRSPAQRSTDIHPSHSTLTPILTPTYTPPPASHPNLPPPPSPPIVPIFFVWLLLYRPIPPTPFAPPPSPPTHTHPRPPNAPVSCVLLLLRVPAACPCWCSSRCSSCSARGAAQTETPVPPPRHHHHLLLLPPPCCRRLLLLLCRWHPRGRSPVLHSPLAWLLPRRISHVHLHRCCGPGDTQKMGYTGRAGR